MADPAAGEISAIRRQIAQAPNDPAPLRQLGRLHCPYDIRRAAVCHSRAAAITIDGSVHYELGTTHLLANEPAIALTAFRRALTSLPATLAVLANLSEAMAQLNLLEDAIGWQQRALALNRGAARVLANLAQACNRAEQPEAGLRKARGAICLEPTLVPAHVNEGLAINGLGRRRQAERSYHRALAIEPHGAEAAFALSTCRLAAGDLRHGFRLYQRRFELTEMQQARSHWTAPFWDGEIKSGLRLLLWCEQGFGDSLHFVRYVPILARRGVRMTLAAPPPLQRLFSSLQPRVPVCGLDDVPSAIDAHAPLMSLPHFLDTRLDSIPCDVPYLSATNTASAEVTSGRPPRIGFFWAGRPEYRADRMRSLSPRTLAALVDVLAMAGGSLYSLQVGPRRVDLDRLRVPVIDLGGGLRDFADTAIAMSALDLIVTIDSAVAHLAGALARPTWVMLSHVPEWRWLEERTDSPWYPTFRLYRQPRPGDWSSVIAAISTDLPDWRYRKQ